MDAKKVDAFLKDKVKELKDEKRHNEMIGTIAAIGETITEDIKKAIESIKIETPTIPEIKIPDIHIPEQKEIKIPDINIPEIKTEGIMQAIKEGFSSLVFPEPKVTVEPTQVTVPEPKVTVNVEKSDAPIVNVPPFPEQMEVVGNVGILGIDRSNPLAVQLVDLKGRPYESIGGSSGGGNPFTIIKDIQTSSGSSVIDQDTGAMKITGNISVSAVSDSFVSLVNADGNYYNSDNPLPITGSLSTSPFATYYASDAVGSMNLIQVGGNSVVVGTGYQDNALRVVIATDSVSSVNVIGTVPVSGTFFQTLQPVSISDAGASVYVNNPVNQGDVATALRVVVAGNSDVSVTATQTGTWNITSITNSTQATLIDSSGIGYSGSNPVPTTLNSLESKGSDVMAIRQVSGASDSVNVLSMPSVVVSSVTASISSSIIDSTGVQYSGSNPLPTKEIRSATPTQTSPSVGVASTSILASNTSRLGATIWNEGSAICYTKLGGTASLTSYSVQIASGGYYEVPFGYTGAIDGITSASTAQLRVTEIT